MLAQMSDIGNVRALKAKDLIQSNRDQKDARRTLVSLTEEGRQALIPLKRTIEIAEVATVQLLEEVSPALYDGLWRLEKSLRQDSFTKRMSKVKSDSAQHR